MATRRPRKSFDPHYWTKVTSSLWCALGGHGVPAGVYVRFRRNDPLRLGSCEMCLKDRYGITHRPFTSSAPDDAVDARARRAGGDE